jgi:hypothetical protein
MAGYTFYECLETVNDNKDDMGFSDPWLMHDVPWTGFCSDWWMQRSLSPLPFGSSFLQDSDNHVIRTAEAQHVPFGEPATYVMPVPETEVGSREEQRVSDDGFYDMLMSATSLLAEAIPFEGAYPVIYDTGATLAVTGMIRTDFTGDYQVPKTVLQLGGMARRPGPADCGHRHSSLDFSSR